MSAPASPWLTVKEAAAYARSNTKAIREALASEELVGEQKVPRGKWRTRPEYLDAWIRGERAEVRIPAVTRRRT